MNASCLHARAAGLLGVMVWGSLPLLGAGTQFALQATSIGTTFLYQGFLREGPNAANGVYDFEFTLFNALEAGDMVGTGTISLDNLAVMDGLFQAALMFPAECFDGQALWLQIAVRSGASMGTFTPLAPRQPLYSAPSALTLRPGAYISGNMEDSILEVKNFGEGPAIFAHTYHSDTVFATCDASERAAIVGHNRSSSGYGIWGLNDSLTGAAVYGLNREGGPALEGRSYRIGGSGIALKASGKILSTEQTVIFIPGVMGVLHGATTGANLQYWGQGDVTINADTTGNKEIVFPITAPALLYGQQVTVFRIHYSFLGASGTPDLNRIMIYRTTDDGEARDIYNDATVVPLSSTWTTAYFSLTTDNKLTFSDGQMAARIRFAMEAGERVEIAALRIQMSHDE